MLMIALWGCDSLTIAKLKRAEFRELDYLVTKNLGADFKVINREVVSEGYNGDKTQYTVDYRFDLNKPVWGFNVVKFPGRMVFEKQGGWRCTYSTAKPGTYLNIFN